MKLRLIEQGCGCSTVRGGGGLVHSPQTLRLFEGHFPLVAGQDINCMVQLSITHKVCGGAYNNTVCDQQSNAESTIVSGSTMTTRLVRADGAPVAEFVDSAAEKRRRISS